MSNARIGNWRNRGLAAAGILLWSLIASAAEEPVKPDQAFRYSVAADGRDIVVRWDIRSGYYLYQERMSFEPRSAGLTLGAPAFPAGEPHEDDFFGLMHIYRGRTDVRIPVTAAPAAGGPVELAIKSQGCADVGLCYPPQTWIAKVDLPAAGAAGPPLAALLEGARDARDPLPVAEAFRHRVTVVDAFTIAVDFQVAPGYYLYRHTLGLASDSAGVQTGTPQLPDGEAFNDAEYGDTLIFRDDVTMTVPLTRAGPAATATNFTLRFQGCKTDSLCYPPQAVAVALELPVATGAPPAAAIAPVSDQDRWSNLIRDGNLAAVLLGFAFAGLLLAFTPCCYPMYPILSGIIVGQSPGTGSGTSQAGGKGTGRALLLSAAFVLGIAITYAILGAIAAAAGAKLQAVLQSPVVTVITVLIFVALALSMFGLYELQIPAAWQTRLNAISGRQQSGTYLGAGVMGMLSAAVLSPCVTPPLVGALMYIAQTGNVPRGAGALFALGCGMGIPLLAIGASAGSVLPRAGAWMVGVKNAFGLIMLGMAVWMLDRLVPGSVTLALCAVLAVLAAVLLGAFTPLAAGAGTLPKFAKGTGVLALVYGAALLVGALAGSESPLQPLQFVGRPAGTPQATAEATLFTRVKTVADFERELARAGTEGRPLLLDFYADWCASCKEMEEQTFPDPAVRTELARAIALQADVTAVDADDQALMARFGIVGPPTIVFFSADGREQPSRRIVGFQPAERFAAHLRSTFAAGTEATALAEAR